MLVEYVWNEKLTIHTKNGYVKLDYTNHCPDIKSKNVIN